MRRRDLTKALGIVVHGDVHRVTARHRLRAARVYMAADRWRRAAGIQGFGIAERVTKGRKAREVVLKVYVDRKRPRQDVEHPVPRRLRVPGVRGAVRTDVEEVGELRLQGFTIRERPASPGVSVGHPRSSAGTLGCLVRRRGSPELYILSNAHVIADSGLASPGELITQPSLSHGGTETDAIAAFERAVPLRPSIEGFLNVADAAIGRVLDPTSVEVAIKLIGVPAGVSADLRRHMLVQKTGSASGHTVGIVRDVNFTAELQYRTADGPRRVGFHDQVLCSRFTDEGDSGALVLDMQGHAVGLHFAGSATASVFNKLDAVLEALEVELVV